MHSIKALVITCVDYRFHKYLFKWLEKYEYLGNCDIISLPGASKDIVVPQDESQRDNVVRYISMSLKLHYPQEILVFDHQDCSGYAADGTIKHNLDITEDFKQHTEYSLKARKLLSEVFNKSVIKTYYISLEGEIAEITP